MFCHCTNSEVGHGFINMRSHMPFSTINYIPHCIPECHLLTSIAKSAGVQSCPRGVVIQMCGVLRNRPLLSHKIVGISSWKLSSVLIYRIAGYFRGVPIFVIFVVNLRVMKFSIHEFYNRLRVLYKVEQTRR